MEKENNLQQINPVFSNKSNKNLIILLIILVTLATGAAVYFAYQDKQLKKQISQIEIKPTPIVEKETSIKVRSLSTGPKGEYIAMIRTSGKDENFKEELVLADYSRTKEAILLQQKGIDANSWIDLGPQNWSYNGQYLYLWDLLPDGGDLYIFKMDDEIFTQAAIYLKASSIGYGQEPIADINWITNSQLEISTGGLLTDEDYPTYILDIEKKTITEKI